MTKTFCPSEELVCLAKELIDYIDDLDGDLELEVEKADDY